MGPMDYPLLPDALQDALEAVGAGMGIPVPGAGRAPGAESPESTASREEEEDSSLDLNPFEPNHAERCRAADAAAPPPRRR